MPIRFKNFFHVYYIRSNNTLHSNSRSSNERKESVILSNSLLVPDPDFIAHFLNTCSLLLTETICLRSPYEHVSLTSGNWRKPFFTQFESMFNRTINQDLVNRIFITNSLTRFLKARQLCYLLPYRTATPRFNKHQGLINWKYRANILNCLLTRCSGHFRRTDILKKSSVDCSRITEKSWKWKILLEVKASKQLQNFTALWNLLERYMASSFFSLSLTLFCQLQHFWGMLWS